MLVRELLALLDNLPLPARESEVWTLVDEKFYPVLSVTNVPIDAVVLFDTDRSAQPAQPHSLLLPEPCIQQLADEEDTGKPNTIKIKAPLPKGIDDTSENRERLQRLVEFRSEDEKL